MREFLPDRPNVLWLESISSRTGQKSTMEILGKTGERDPTLLSRHSFLTTESGVYGA
jgi:hypothetical protein